jgi:TolA-binding protein
MMKKPLQAIAMLLPAVAVLHAGEPSAFGAGNLDSEQPYGLTQTEKSIYENRKTLRAIQSKSRENSLQLQSLRERIDGLQTVIEGLSEKAQVNRKALGAIENEQQAAALERDEKIKALEDSLTAQEANIEALKTLLESLAAQVDTINADYVSKDEYNRLVRDVNAFKRDMAGVLKKVAAPAASTDPYAKLSSKQLAAKAKKNYDELYFRKAIPMYEELIRRNYKPAYAHFMIGEMWHYRKKWDKALSYYKASAKLYDKASYMPKLMLHSAECMMHTGDEAHAKRFLEALKAKYPDAPEAAEADRLLSRL